MPELPEVETVVRDLRPLLVGRVLAAVVRTTAVSLRRPWDVAWAAKIPGQRVESVTRRGKWIVLDLTAGCLVVHLGMTGQLVVEDAAMDRRPHTHFVFPLDDGRELRYSDARRFGSVQYFADREAREAFFAAAGLGPEPFDLDPAWWRDRLAATTRNLKATLLDQSLVAGVGNIYADEALFHARLHPARRACDLARAEAERLRKAVAAVLTQAIEQRGSTIRDYVGGSGLQGGYQNELAVYGRTAEPCPRCGTPIAQVRLAGRSSHFCPACQPMP